ncbi:MAG: protein BatD, partial [Chitinophagaceae bacterium]|nr:protein BatD [Chitinophagaceae bacterium]
TFIINARYNIVLTFLLLLLGGIVTAQVKFNTNISAVNTSLDEYFQIEFIIENAESIEDFAAPAFRNFRILQGPSESSNVSIINGSMTRSQSVSYILMPLTTGKQTIPGAIAVINGKSMRSNAVTVAVSAEARNPGANKLPRNVPFIPGLPDRREDVSEEYRLLPDEDAKSRIMKNLLVKLDVSKKSCYAGEPIIATYKLYSRLRSESRITRRPSLNGFSVYDMEDPTAQSLSVEKLNGINYNVHIIRRSQLLPLQPGKYVLDPVELENKVEFVRAAELGKGGGRGSGSPMERMMDDFFGRSQPGSLEEHNITLKSEPVTITVNPLPEEKKPEGFDGAVGNFNIKAALKKKIIKAGEVAELEVAITGAGNIPMINPPRITLLPDMEAFEPSVKETVDKKVYPLRGSKVINYTFLIRNEGDYTIPPVRFSYFNPADKTYRTVSSDSLSIHVDKSNKSLNKPADTPGLNDGVAARSGWTDAVTKELVLGGAAILLLIGITIYLLSRKRKKKVISPVRSVETAVEPSITAVAPVSLEQAADALEEGRSQDFYSEVNKALREAVCRKTGLASSELTKFNISFKLREKGVGPEPIQDLEAILKECELALYTPIHEERDMRNTMEKAGQVIAQL